MPTRVAVTQPYFHFFPELKAELLAKYPGAKFRTDTRQKLDEAELIEFLRGHDAALIGVDRFTENVFKAVPELKVLSLSSAGVDHLDPEILNKYGVKMYYAAGINKYSVSEIAICYMLIAIRRVHFLSSILWRGEWKGAVGFGMDLRGRTIGVHGVGYIGKEVIKRLKAFDVKILGCDRIDFSDFYKEWGVEKVDQEELWARSDVITIHLSRNRTTLNLYDGKALDKMKKGAILVNTARGNLVDEQALKERLENGHLAAAAFDVFAVEPANGHPLLKVPNFFGSPHIASTTVESWTAMLRSGIYGLEHAYRQEPTEYPFV